MFVIRLANVDDVSAIKHCAKAAYAPYVKRMGKRPAPMVADFDNLVHQQSVYVLDADKHIRGYIVCFPKQDHFHIENIAVAPEFHRRGYGKQLMKHAETEALARGFSRIELYTNEKMRENLKLYPKLGYEEFARHFQDGFARVFFRKQL